jgi:adenosylcobinamide-phosphate synthase
MQARAVRLFPNQARSGSASAVLISFVLAGAALILEILVGYPQWLFAAIGHPVTWMGKLITVLNQRLNREGASPRRRRSAGVFALLLLLFATLMVSAPLALATRSSLGFVACALLASSLLAQRSLATHVRAVAEALETGGLESGRRAVAMIVGRNPASLDEAAVARAAVESLAENFADGVVAPAFWIVVLGLPGGALYKSINTADSMIGHKTERFRAFGWAAARLDDLVNLPASRLAALWLVAAAVLVGGNPRRAVLTVWRDAGKHRSPNAGWPEAAMAGALGFALAGPRVYGDTRVLDAYMGDGRPDLGPKDIRAALRLYRVACAIQIGTLAVTAALLWWLRGQ